MVWYSEFRKLMPLRLLNVETPESSMKLILRLCHKNWRSRRPNPRLLLLVEKSIDRMMERINIGNWKEVTINDRQTITILSYYMIILFIENYHDKLDSNLLACKVSDIIDKGLLFGAPLPFEHNNLLQKCASIVKINNEGKKHVDKWDPLKFNLIQKINRNPEIVNGTLIDVLTCPSLESFHKNHMIPRIPVVLKNCIDDWPAMNRWNRPAYFIANYGHRVVPVEFGSKYTDQDWSQSILTLSEFICKHVLNSGEKIGYLAQHQLFDQIPELLKDIKTPDYCCLHVDGNEDDAVDKNAWFGPANTISPLHTDPKHNLLAQIVGEKLVVLFCPEDAPYLYTYEEELLSNTAQVDPLDPDLDKFPKYAKATPKYYIIKAGDILYIPPKWWHYVKSLSVSFSVSFWWN